MNKFKKMKELESDGLDVRREHTHRESYSEELHGNLHQQAHHNLKNKNLRI